MTDQPKPTIVAVITVWRDGVPGKRSHCYEARMEVTGRNVRHCGEAGTMVEAVRRALKGVTDWEDGYD